MEITETETQLLCMGQELSVYNTSGITGIKACVMTVNEGDKPQNGFAFMGILRGYFVTLAGDIHNSVFNWKPVGLLDIDIPGLLAFLSKEEKGEGEFGK